MKDDDLTAGSLALSARFTLRFQQASPLVKNLISIRSRSRFRGRSEMSTRCCGGPQVVWQKKSGRIGVSAQRPHQRRSHTKTVSQEHGPATDRWGEERQPQQSRTEPSPGRQRTHPVALSYSHTPEGIASVKCRLGRPRSARRRDEHQDSRRGRACRPPRYGMPYPIRAYTITKVPSRSAATRLV